MKTEYSIDYMTVTTKKQFYMLRHYNLSNEVKARENGMFGYNVVNDFADGRIEAYSTTRPDVQGAMMQYNGSSLRRLGDMSAMDIAKYHYTVGHKCSRIDIAIDLFDSGLLVGDLRKAKDNGQIKTRSQSFYHADNTEGGETFYIGYKKPKMVRVYNKAAEQGLGGEIDWIRIEFQLRKEYAQQVLKAVCETDDVGKIIVGLIKQFVHFPNVSQWCEVMKGEGIKLSETKKGDPKTMQWLLGDVAKAIAKMYLGDYPDVMERLNDAVKSELAIRASEYIRE